MRIAIVHDYFVQLGGAERVAEELYRMEPEASVFATVCLEDRLPDLLQGVTVHTSWLQNLPFLRRLYRFYFLLYPFGVSSLDLQEYDLVLSSSSGYAKGVRTARHAVHICYCHTPMRWVWNYDKYSERESIGGAAKSLIKKAISALRLWDVRASRQPDHFIANSTAVAKRIEEHYGRRAQVIYPPIDVERFTVSDHPGDFYLVLSRLVPYKRIDLAIRACNLLQRKLVVIGAGPDRVSLEKIAGPTIRFAGRLSDREVERTVAECKALLFPGEEDFGMAPLELAAAGKPTIAYGAGGALETVVDGETGTFFMEPTPESLADAMIRFEKRSWSPAVLRAHAERFSIQVFQQKMREFLRKAGGDSTSRYRSLIRDYQTLSSHSKDERDSSRPASSAPAILPFYHRHPPVRPAASEAKAEAEPKQKGA